MASAPPKKEKVTEVPKADSSEKNSKLQAPRQGRGSPEAANSKQSTTEETTSNPKNPVNSKKAEGPVVVESRDVWETDPAQAASIEISDESKEPEEPAALEKGEPRSIEREEPNVEEVNPNDNSGDSKKEDAPEVSVPTVDLNAPLKIEEKEQEVDVPETDINASLNIEEIKGPGNIPESNMNAPLAIEEKNGLGEEHHEDGGKKMFLVGTLIALVVVGCSALFFFFFLRSLKMEDKSSVVVEKTSSEPVKAPVFERSEWSLEVLNGSGVPGLAKKVADKLEALGYKIVKVGNADAGGYTETEVLVTEELFEQAESLMADIGSEFNEATLAGVLKDSTASARIVVGSKDAE